ncbi:DUF3307 domain-containing protein [Pacificoceanicola onchidii]|uniref:DUF3307 domain-containing protein n=1 Tax=Pacificoceanicola onchidii TaxID=2562685 RepID=UPI001F103927|nr:DUF3307 domain-containing protein [Pacificoceanicola onchidii]
MTLMDLVPPLSAPALQVFTALLLAHVLADFLFQTKKMVAHKGNVLVLGLHVLIVFALSTLALGGVWQVAAMVAAAHFVIDMIKVIWRATGQGDGLAPFLLDQAAHLVSLLAAALLWPGAMALGWWDNDAVHLVAPALLASGLILTVIAGGMAVGLLTARYQGEISDDSLPDAGRLIGQLERFIIFVLVMIGEPAGIGFLIAAKSVLRFDTASQGQKASEYVIIGTLASFSWALVMAYGTQALLEIAAQAS